MKIGVFAQTLDVFGGGEFVAIAIANTLAKNNYQTVLFTNKKVNPKAIQDFFGESLHPSIQTVKQPTLVHSRGQVADFYQTIFQSYALKSKCEVFIDTFTNCVFPWTDICYIHFPFLNQYSYSAKFPYLSSHRLLQVGALPQVLLEKNLVQYNEKLILANSRYTAKEIKKYSGKKSQILYPPFTPTISKLSKQERKRESLIVTTSRFEPNKRLEIIPHIAAQTSPDIKFAIIGRLYSKETLFALQKTVKKLNLEDRVKFYPDLPFKEKIDLLKSAKLYLHTMIGEHFGISIVEAMALGCIPIVHNSGGMREFVPKQYWYETLQEAACSINNQIHDWSSEKMEESKEIAEYFSYANFSKRFMNLFSNYCAVKN